MELGVCYFPEHWDRSLWAEDARRMVDLGLSVVRIGEFAWSCIEPAPGQFDWDWYDRAIDMLASAGLDLILCTPTATPPKWLVDTHPDILCHDRHGRPRRFGSRRHYCFSSSTYRAESARITTALAERYGQHEAVIAWQTDNELGCHDTVRSYSPAAEAAFRIWLAERHGDVDALNAAWGTVFWSQTYRSFDEVDLPNLTVTEPNPSHVLDFYRFSSDQLIAYNKMQVDILRAHSPGRDVLHNFMGLFTDFDHFQLGVDIDIAGWDSYPLGFLDVGPYAREDKAAYMRQGHPDFAGFHHDLYRNCGRGRFGIIEQQPGPVNWARNNPAPLDGMVRLWGHETAAHGAELSCIFRWRQAPFAQEQMHAGLLRPDSQPATAHGEIAQLAKELETPDSTPSSPRIALVFSYDSQWMTEIQPQGRSWSTIKLAMEWYSAARGLGLSLDIVAPGAPLDAYDLVLVPSLLHVSDAALQAFEATSADIIFAPRSGSKTESLQIPDTLAPGPLQSLIPLKVTRSESFPPTHVETGQLGDKTVTGHTWLDHVETELTPLAQTETGTGLLYRSGRVSLFTTCPNRAFLQAVLGDICADRGIRTIDLPAGVRLIEHGRRRVVVNYNASDQQVPALGIEHLPPAGVANLSES